MGKILKKGIHLQYGNWRIICVVPAAAKKLSKIIKREIIEKIIAIIRAQNVTCHTEVSSHRNLGSKAKSDRVVLCLRYYIYLLSVMFFMLSCLEGAERGRLPWAWDFLGTP